MSAQEVARLAPADSDVELLRIKAENLTPSVRDGRRLSRAAAAAASAAGSPRTPSASASASDSNTPLRSIPRPLLPRPLPPPAPAGTSSQTLPTAPDQLPRTPTMSSQRRGAPRTGPRGGSGDNGVNRAELADEIQKAMGVIAEAEKRAKVLKDKIILLEQRMRKKQDDGLGLPISDHTELEALYREQVKIVEEQRARVSDESLLTRIQLLRDIQKTHEQEEWQQASARNSNSRASAVDFDGPSDSPVPSPADNRHVRKMGGSRTSSQPPRSNIDRLDGASSEVNERASKPKIMYSLKEEVAFKRKLPSSKPEDQDWIQGEVVRVIGEGKSRRYEVKDIDPDAVGGSNLYKSSASQMVPIPPEGAPLGDYEPGKQVLALYPAATTFYRAQVKSMVDAGTRVLVLFEEEDVEKSIARRFVLDHKG